MREEIVHASRYDKYGNKGVSRSDIHLRSNSGDSESQYRSRSYSRLLLFISSNMERVILIYLISSKARMIGWVVGSGQRDIVFILRGIVGRRRGKVFITQK